MIKYKEKVFLNGQMEIIMMENVKIIKEMVLGKAIINKMIHMQDYGNKIKKMAKDNCVTIMEINFKEIF